MNDLMINVVGLGKKFSYGRSNKVETLKEVFHDWLIKPKNIGQDEAVKEFWALRDVSFKVKRGEVVGVIGSNGAGKSTLLKILSRVMLPTTGEAHLFGKLASLLDVGTGFHPDLTGAENIYLNGTIMGMARKEIQRKFGEIVDFSGIGKFIDTPVKYYSSGMYTRLAFSASVYLDADILFVDEVLAVGDLDFQRRSMDKMEEITRKQGRTIIFVSHNLTAVQRLCDRVMFMEAGKIVKSGATFKITGDYIESTKDFRNLSLKKRSDRQGNGWLRAVGVTFRNRSNQKVNQIGVGEELRIEVEFENYKKGDGQLNFSLSVVNTVTQTGAYYISSQLVGKSIRYSGRKGMFVVVLPKTALNAGRYALNVWLEDEDGLLDWVIEAGRFSVVFGDFYGQGVLPDLHQAVNLVSYQIK